jgi:hypothetical protein
MVKARYLLPISLGEVTSLIEDRLKTGAFPCAIKKRLHAEAAARRATMTAYRRHLLFL